MSWEGVISTLVGGLLALGGVWLAFYLQRRSDARVLRATLLAELEAARDAFTRRNREDPILEMLDGWEKSGTAPFAGLIGQSLDMEPSVAFPVYYARAGDLGALGIADASAIVSHYADAMGLLRSARLILSIVRSDADTSDAARQLRKDYLRLLEGREELIAQLSGTPNPRFKSVAAQST